MDTLETPLLTVTVNLHAGAAGLAGVTCAKLRLANAATAADAKAALAALHPALAPLLASCVLATDTEYLRDDARIGDALQLHLIPPVSGG